MTPALFERIAEHFKALSDPNRLQILQTLRRGSLPVNDIVSQTGLGQANVSKHLRMLHELGFVTRHKAGLHVFYALTGDDVARLCEIMCGRLEHEVAATRRLLTSR